MKSLVRIREDTVTSDTGKRLSFGLFVFWVP